MMITGAQLKEVAFSIILDSNYCWKMDIILEIKFFDRSYLGKFLSDFEKLGTVLIGEASSLNWAPIIIILKNIYKK